MAGSSFSYDRLDPVPTAPARSRVGARVGRRRRWRWLALLAVLAALGLGTAWAHPGGDGWGHDGASYGASYRTSYGTSWWVKHTPKPEHGGQISDDGQEGDHVGDHHGPPPGVFGCMIEPSKTSLKGAFHRSLQAEIQRLRGQYGSLYYQLHYSYTFQTVDASASPATIVISWSGSVLERGSKKLITGSGSATDHYLWQGCHWVETGGPAYTAN